VTSTQSTRSLPLLAAYGGLCGVLVGTGLAGIVDGPLLAESALSGGIAGFGYLLGISAERSR
jgi:hypothetical protein